MLTTLLAAIAIVSALMLAVGAMLGQRVVQAGPDGVIQSACARCGYTIHGHAARGESAPDEAAQVKSPAQCPECGAALDRAEALRGVVRRRSRAEIAWTVAMLVLAIAGWSFLMLGDMRQRQLAALGTSFPNSDLDPVAIAAALAIDPTQLPRGLNASDAWRLIEQHARAETLPPRAIELLLRAPLDLKPLLCGPDGAAGATRVRVFSGWVEGEISFKTGVPVDPAAAALRAIIEAQVNSDPRLAFAWTERIHADLELDLTVVDAGGPDLHVFVTPRDSFSALAVMANAAPIRRTIRTDEGEELLDFDATGRSIGGYSVAGGTLCAYAGTIRRGLIGIDVSEIPTGPRVNVPNTAQLSVEVAIGAGAEAQTVPPREMLRVVRPEHLRVARLAQADPKALAASLRAGLADTALVREPDARRVSHATIHRMRRPASALTALAAESIGLAEPSVELRFAPVNGEPSPSDRVRITMSWSVGSHSLPSWSLPALVSVDEAQLARSDEATMVVKLAPKGAVSALTQILSIVGPELCFDEPVEGLEKVTQRSGAGGRLYTPPPVLIEALEIEVPVRIEPAESQP